MYTPYSKIMFMIKFKSKYVCLPIIFLTILYQHEIYSEENLKKNSIEDYENYESYRPQSYSDANKNPLSKDSLNDDLDRSSERESQAIKDYENYESYRPQSYSDATRNPLNKVRK